jgi:hypothetical protein
VVFGTGRIRAGMSGAAIQTALESGAAAQLYRVQECRQDSPPTLTVFRHVQPRPKCQGSSVIGSIIGRNRKRMRHPDFVMNLLVLVITRSPARRLRMLRLSPIERIGVAPL